MFHRAFLIASIAVGALSTPALAQTAGQMDPNITARQSLMRLQAYNIGVLGGMAQGRMAYDAEAAATAAQNLLHLTQINSRRMWAEGTDNSAMEGTRALPAIWATPDEFAAAGAALASAASAMAAVAGTDLASLQGAIRGLGGACGACHQAFRQPE